jgi:hypothetical protein
MYFFKISNLERKGHPSPGPRTIPTVGVIKITPLSRKMFETLPIFNDSLECKHFMLMPFLSPGNTLLACYILFLASQRKWAATDGHDVTPFSPCTKIFHKIQNQNNTKCTAKLSWPW